LGSEIFTRHEHDDVQLLVACCIADIFRVFAPDSPYENPDDLKVSVYNQPLFDNYKVNFFLKFKRRFSSSFATSSKVSRTYQMVRSIDISTS
jgi:hypothetical protein